MPIIKTRDETEIYFKDWGKGDPVILIHGWPLNADSWDDVAQAIADAGMRAIAYDRRGFGRSSQPDGGYDYDTFADDLADVIKATGATENATLVGFSMGGGEVARYLSRHGAQGISKAALISSVVPYMPKTEDNPNGVDPSVFQQMTDGIKKDRAHFFRGFMADFFGVGFITSPVSEEMVEWAWGLCMQAGLRPTLAAANAFATTDFRPDLPAFTVPTLIVHGTGDKTVPAEATGKAAAAAISGSTYLEYDGAPHGLWASHKDQFIGDLLDFLRGGSSSDGFMLRDEQDRTQPAPFDTPLSNPVV